jgi:hypothetical protein
MHPLPAAEMHRSFTGLGRFQDDVSAAQDRVACLRYDLPRGRRRLASQALPLFPDSAEKLAPGQKSPCNRLCYIA